VKDGKAVAVRVSKKVEKTVLVLKEVRVETWVTTRGVKVVLVTTRVLVRGTMERHVLLMTRVVLSVRVLGVNVVMMEVVVRTKVRVVVSKVVKTLVVVRTKVVVVKVMEVMRLVLVTVRVELIKRVLVKRSVLVTVRVLVWGKV
jgi:hypothetical protein